MRMNLRVIDGRGGFRAVPFHSERDRKTIYNRIYNECLENIIENVKSMNSEGRYEATKKFIFAAVKSYRYMDISYAMNDFEFMKVEMVKFINIMNVIALFSPRDISIWFPPIKRYDGNKYGEKDYFSSMKAVIMAGDRAKFKDDIAAYDFLTSYQNKDIIRFSSMGERIADEFNRLHGIYTDANGANNQIPHLYVVH